MLDPVRFAHIMCITSKNFRVLRYDLVYFVVVFLRDLLNRALVQVEHMFRQLI